MLACFFVVVAGFVGVVFVGGFVCFWLVDWWLLSIVVVVCLLLMFVFFSLFVGLFGGGGCGLEWGFWCWYFCLLVVCLWVLWVKSGLPSPCYHTLTI